MNSVSGAYSSSIKKVYYSLISLLVVLELIIIRLNWSSLHSEALVAATIKLVLASTFPITIFYRLFFIIRPWLMASYTFENGLLTIQFKKKKKEIKLEDIAKISPSIVPPRFFGGVTLELHSGQKIRIFAVLQQHQELLEAIKQGRSEIFQANSWEYYFAQVKNLVPTWEYMKRGYFNKIDIIIRFILAPIFSLVLYWYVKQPGESLSVFMTNNYWAPLLMMFVAFFVVEMLEHRVFLGQLESQKGEVSSSLHYIFLALYVVLLIGGVYLLSYI